MLGASEYRCLQVETFGPRIQAKGSELLLVGPIRKPKTTSLK
jgi:hypothetical protein